jgi:hypothetical protein
MGAMGAKQLEVWELRNHLTDAKWVGVSDDWGGLMGAVASLGCQVFWLELSVSLTW